MKLINFARPSLAAPGAIRVDEHARDCQYRHMWDPKARGRRIRLSGAAEEKVITLGEDFTTKVNGVDYSFKAGQVLTLSVTPADVSNQNVEVESWLGKFSNNGFVADILSPVVLVDQEAAKRRDFSDDNTFEYVDTAVGRHGNLNEIKHMSAVTPYATQEHGLAAYIPFGAESDAIFNIKLESSQMLKEKIDLAREKRVIDRLTTVGNWNGAQTVTLGASTYWDTGASKNVILDIETRINASVQGVSFLAMNPEVAGWMLRDTNVQARLRMVNGDSALTNVNDAIYSTQVTQLTLNGLPDILVCPAKIKLPGASVPTWILGDDVIFLSNPGQVNGAKMCTSATFRTRGRGGNGWTVNEYITQNRGLENGTMMSTGYKEIDFFGSNKCGGLIKNVLST